MRKVFLLLCLISPISWSLEITETCMTGQYPVECAPTVIEYKGERALLSVNRGGQVMLWSVEGKDLGPGPDGIVAQLPKGEWSSSPVACGGRSACYAFCNGEGRVVMLDEGFKTRWEYDLGAATNWGAACGVGVTPTGRTGLSMCWADMSGRITCLDSEGGHVWKTQLEFGACKAPLQTFGGAQGLAKILAASGTRLCCLDSDGRVLWTRDLRGAIISRPEVFDLSGKRVILCGAGSGYLFALTPEGEIAWEAAVGDEIDSTIALLPRPSCAPLILCRGLWGNLYAFDENGRRVWTHLFRAKNRSRPLVFHADGDGDMEILCTAYNQHAYLFDHEGRLVDDLRLGGCINGSPIPITDAATHRTDVFVVTAALLAQRIRFSPPRSPYASTPAPDSVSCDWPDAGERGPGAAIVLCNPQGALLDANLELVAGSGERLIRGRMTARSMFEIPFPETIPDNSTELRLIVTDARNKKIIDQRNAGSFQSKADEPPAESLELAAWPTPAYGAFDETRLAPWKQEKALCGVGRVSIPNLYVGETEAGAFVVASRLDDQCRVRIDLAKPVTADGKPFGGAITLYEVVSTRTVNGEAVPDALVKLNDANITLLSPKRSSKFWVSVNAYVAAPGEYNGRITVQPLRSEADTVSLEICIRVFPLEIKRPFPLTLCTWDYIPNQWFPDRTPEVLDDMVRHGVSVFPRTSCIPKGSVDEKGQLTLDTQTLDAELKRLEGRGQILIQLGVPAIAFPPAAPSPEQQHAAQIEYLHGLRDHLKERGWDYDDYAFYPVDEPGLGYGGSVSALIEAGTLFREADPRFRIYTDPVPSISKVDFERIEPLIDVWCPNMRLVSGLLAGDPRMKRIRDSGKTVWSYECVSQVKSISPLRYNRAAAWRAHFFGLSGIGFWTFSTTEVNHWLPGKGTNDEYALVYPGALPVPSVRWEAVRDGLEDIAAVMLLEEAVASGTARGDASDVVKEAKEALRIAQVDMLELSDEAFVESRDYLRQGDRTIPHTWTDVETYAAHRDRIARLTLALTEGK